MYSAVVRAPFYFDTVTGIGSFHPPLAATALADTALRAPAASPAKRARVHDEGAARVYMDARSTQEGTAAADATADNALPSVSPSPPAAPADAAAAAVAAAAAAAHAAGSDTLPPGAWECGICTYINSKRNTKKCAVCGGRR
ncbi:hypothetical protein EON67_09685 [archaeon]|nr:MAG: hypothetical protein EON67_09685 [archaeon]